MFYSKVFKTCSKFQKYTKKIIASELIALKLSLRRREYMSSAVNVLTNRLKIFDITKTDFFQHNYLRNDP